MPFKMIKKHQLMIPHDKTARVLPSEFNQIINNLLRIIPPINIIPQKNQLIIRFRINHLNQPLQGSNTSMNIANSNNPPIFP